VPLTVVPSGLLGHSVARQHHRDSGILGWHTDAMRIVSSDPASCR
jgi:hypothetical protein